MTDVPYNERVQACPEADPRKVAQLQALQQRLDPFVLAEAIDQQLTRLYALAQHRSRTPPPPAHTAVARQAVQALSACSATPVSVGSEAGLSRRGKRRGK